MSNNIHWWYSQNPSFCPSKYHEGMSMDDRFKKSVGCLRPCSCYECKNLNIDRAIGENLTRIDILAQAFGKGILFFLNCYIVWGLATTLIFGISMNYITVDVYSGVFWYNSFWFPIALISGCLFLCFLWISWIIWRSG